MKNTTIEAPYPYNLLAEILPDGEYEIMDDDQQDGLAYAIGNSLTQREHDMLLLYYRDGLTLEQVGAQNSVTRERVRQIVAKACRKLRHPSARYWIVKGYRVASGELGEKQKARWADEIETLESMYVSRVSDLRKKISEVEKKSASLDTLTTLSDAEAFVQSLDEPIENWDLSVRSFNCLYRAGLRTAGAICEKRMDELAHVRNLGRKSLEEVVGKIHAHGLKLKGE